MPEVNQNQLRSFLRTMYEHRKMLCPSDRAFIETHHNTLMDLSGTEEAHCLNIMARYALAIGWEAAATNAAGQEYTEEMRRN